MASGRVNITLGTKYNGAGVTGLRKGLASVGKSIATVGRNLVNIQAGFQMLSGAASKFASIFSKAFRFETQTTQFKAFVGTMEEAREHMADLKELGDTPPFSLDEFAKASRSLMVMTDGVLGYKRSLEMIGDVAAATGYSIEELGQAVGRMYAFIRDGQPLSRAVMQLRNMGVITPEVAQKLQDLQAAGRSNAEIWAEVETQLSRYEGAMAETEKTGDGLMSAISARWDNIVRTFGEAFEDAAKDGMGEMLDGMEELEESGALERWAANAAAVLAKVAKSFESVSSSIGKAWDHLMEGREYWKEEAAATDEAVDDAEWTLLKEENPAPYQKKRTYVSSDGRERYEYITDEAAKKKYMKEQRELDRKKRQQDRDAKERARMEEDLARAQQRQDEEKAKKKAEEEKKAAEKAAKEMEKLEAKAAKERERLDRERHQKRMADLRAEIAEQNKAEAAMRTIAIEARSEFEKTFAMYRDPAKAAEEIAEERDYQSDLDRLHRDAGRYGGKWRIDELSGLMAAGDTQGVTETLKAWRKNSRFTPEIEAMVRASAAERTQTTVEDELRKIEKNTADLGSKLENLLAMKGGE